MSMVAGETPQLVFWEVTKACPLACAHCRASAIHHPLPGELTTEQGIRLIEQVASFGRPAPILVMTGGDVLMREDLDVLLGAARSSGVRVALAPAVSPLLDERRAAALRELGVRSVSISLDGIGVTHDQIRGISGHYARTVETVAMLQRHGFSVQVNTVVMRRNVGELARVARYLVGAGVRVWEVFFLIEVGRGRELESLSALENEDVARFLYAASGYGLLVRTVEGPFVRRVGAELASGAPVSATTPVGQELLAELRRGLGAPIRQGRIASSRTRDGAGIIFVAHDGEVFPSGFLPLSVGSVPEQSLVEVYRESPLLQEIRASRFHGPCGECDYRDLCGGSRARAFAVFGDPLASDPGCVRAAGWVA